jgi:hypothetical protein
MNISDSSQRRKKFESASSFCQKSKECGGFGFDGGEAFEPVRSGSGTGSDLLYTNNLQLVNFIH